ncbi:MAG: hypothetical protein HY291_08460 [Planctomycetes bacterium]|nr:hypothetical protein [Planctomycetota bacterium]
MFLNTIWFTVLCYVGGLCAFALLLTWLLGVRYIPHSKVGIIEKLWSPLGSLKDGQIIALDGRAGFQAEVLRGGLHIGYFPWQYRIHTEPLVVVSESKIGYVYARDGAPLPPTQTLGKSVPSNSFQDGSAFLRQGGQRGRQRAFLREGVYAINTALFVVISEKSVYAGPIRESEENRYGAWQAQLGQCDGFRSVQIGHAGRNREREQAVDEREVASTPGVTATDTIGVVTVHDGPTIDSGEIIAPEVKAPEGQKDHNYFQDPEAFLALGGRRGKQLQVLTDGTYFINRWFATVEIQPKTLVPIGSVGVVVSYYGIAGLDVTGVGFRYGEQVEPGQRGVWKRALPPGKYALNPYALKVEMVPTVNFVLRWITGQVEAHRYDEDLKSIELITADGYEPTLPLSLVLHIDYEKAPSVIQRFGDVKRLISQTLDPILSAYFRDVAQSSHMLDLLTKRDEIQRRATEELAKRFREYDINCIAVLIGRPESQVKSGQEDPIERLFDQLRMRRLAEEQIGTFAKQEEAAAKQRELNDARAAAEKQAELTQTKIGIEIAGNKAEAQLAEAQRLAKRDIARAEGEARTKVLLAEGESRSVQLMAEGESKAQELMGKGEGARIAQTGLSEAAVFLQKIRAYGDPRLFALNLVSEQFAHSAQPLVPERLFISGAGAGANGNGKHDGSETGVLGPLLSLLLSEKAGVDLGDKAKGLEELEALARELTKKYATGAAQDGGDGTGGKDGKVVKLSTA